VPAGWRGASKTNEEAARLARGGSMARSPGGATVGAFVGQRTRVADAGDGVPVTAVAAFVPVVLTTR
jgi:hypothetical protein